MNRLAAVFAVALLAACHSQSPSSAAPAQNGGGGDDNHAPTAVIAPDLQSVDEGGTVSLSGDGSTDADGDTLTYAWTRVAGPALPSDTVLNDAQLSFTAPQVSGDQVLQLKLTVSDGRGGSDFAIASVTLHDTTPAANQSPVADAGPDKAATAGDTVALDGSGSHDPENSALSFAWTQVDGPSVTLSDAGTAVPSFSAPPVSVPTPVKFALTVEDSSGAQGVDEIVVTVAPVSKDVPYFQAQCEGQGGPAALCAALGQAQTGAPDRLPVASTPTPRGGITHRNLGQQAPSEKIIDGDPSDWIGAPTRISGTERLDHGELIYSDYLFDAYGADDGTDAQRLKLLDPLAQVEPRTFRFDQLFQAAGDQFGAPAPIGALDHYGDATDLSSQADLYELRLAADATHLYVLARFTTLTDADKPALLLLLDTGAGPGDGKAVGFGSGLSTSRFDTAVLITSAGAQLRDLKTGAITTLDEAQVMVNPGSEEKPWTNALEAALPAGLLKPGTRVAAVSGPRTADGFTPANVAFRYAEPVAGVYNDKAQALALLGSNIDGFTQAVEPGALRAGVSESWALAPGYVERQFESGDNISRESGEEGKLQPYGLYVPTGYRAETASRLTFWTHYRGGKAHSGAAWTPRLIAELGEEQDNIVATPRARGTSTWYVTKAHQDFFEVANDLIGTTWVGGRMSDLPLSAGLLNIDASHVYISGYSMGGYATYLFGLLYPDLFAGGFASSGAMTQGLWTGLGPDEDYCKGQKYDVPEVGEANLCFGEANEGDADAQLTFRILENAREFPIMINHGTDDELVPITGVQRIGAQLLQLGYRYELEMFFGYEHYTQAIIDEWGDGASYLNRFARPLNPRQVTYKVSPALVHALNTVHADGVSFGFNPDGAYWVDGLTVRGADVTNTAQFGRIDAESLALPGTRELPLPVVVDVDAPTVSTPVISPGGHSTPYFKHGQEWIDLGALPNSNAFNATLTNLAAASLDAKRMALDLTQEVDGAVDSDGTTTLKLTQIATPVQVYVNGQQRSGALSGNTITLALNAGLSQITLLPPGAVLPPSSTGAYPDAAALCGALGAQAAPVCAQIGSGLTQLESACAALGTPGECSAFGGNLHGLVDACRDNSGPEQICKGVEQVMLGAASACREAALPSDFCALLSGLLIDESEVAAFRNSWTAQALALQRALGDVVPFHDADFPATHNSFNYTTANFPQTLSGSDSNQKYSIPDQLDMGIRAIEVDVHWMPGPEGTLATAFREPMVCHGNADHFGCTTERPLSAVLAELRPWLDAHPDQVIALYIEANIAEAIDNTAQSFPTTAGVIEQYLGTGSAKDLVYRPAQHGSSCDSSGTIADPNIWINLTREQIRAAGKQVFIFTGTCGEGSEWPALVHNKKDPAYVETGSHDGFDGATCKTPNGDYSAQTYATKWTRFFEDSTLVSAVTGGPGPLMSADDVRNMVACGVNMPSLDQVTPSDARLPAFVWSWAAGEPDANPLKTCALAGADGRFHAADCTETHPHACVNATDPRDWVLGASDIWSADAGCPTGYAFGVPHAGSHSAALQRAKGATAVWLDYRIVDGNWTAP